MKKFIKKGILFLFGFIIIYSFISIITPRDFFYPTKMVLNNNWAETVNDIKKYNNADIVFVGGSHVYRTFDPYFFEKEKIKVFNLSSTVQSSLNSYFILDNFINSFKPKIVVLEMYPASLDSDGVESFFNRLTIKPTLSIQDFNETLAINNIYTYNSFFSEFFKRVFIKNNVCTSPKTKDMCIYIEYVKAGFCASKKSYQKEQTEKNLTIKPYYIKINKKQIDYFVKTINLLKEKNIKVLVVTQPITKFYKKQFLNYDSIIRKIADVCKYNNVEYINFEDYIELNDYKDFFDSNHLNRSGVEKFDNVFIKLIKEKKLI